MSLESLGKRGSLGVRASLSSCLRFNQKGSRLRRLTAQGSQEGSSADRQLLSCRKHTFLKHSFRKKGHTACIGSIFLSTAVKRTHAADAFGEAIAFFVGASALMPSFGSWPAAPCLLGFTPLKSGWHQTDSGGMKDKRTHGLSGAVCLLGFLLSCCVWPG